jgi:hypothetical protein
LGTSFGVAVKNLRNLTISEPEYEYYKTTINAPIEIDDMDEKEKFIEEHMNFSEKYDFLSVNF